MIEKTKIGPKFICHPNGMILKVLNQRSRKSPFRAVVSARCGTVLRLTSLFSPSAAVAAAAVAASMVKMETETKRNRNAEQRVKQLKHIKQRANQQHYSHVHHWPPQQQYKSKNWTIAIILNLTLLPGILGLIKLDTNPHTENSEYCFDIVANIFQLICTSQSTNTQYDTEGVICSGKLYVIYYLPGRDWGYPNNNSCVSILFT